MADILLTGSEAERAVAIARAVDRLKAGDVVALPTETVYGLAANAFDAEAVARIYEVKGRPAHNPIIVHVADLDMARQCAATWPAAADRLARSFWPGPLTLVVTRAPVVPDIVTAGGNTVGIRWPSHPVMEAVIRACGFPLAAPSANRSNALSPTTAFHVEQSLGDRIELIVDGGASEVGIESTVVDLVASPPRVLRPGMIHAAAIELALGSPLHTGNSAVPVGQLRSPGLLTRHYAPRTPLVVLSWRDSGDLDAQLAARSLSRANVYVLAHRQIPTVTACRGVAVMPHDAETYARALYSELHRADEAGADVVVVESVPDAPEWNAVRDRLSRASADAPL
jgi:L-threonylcarbamoyladenylate synthase